MMKNQSVPTQVCMSNQQGAVLVICLILLFILTMIGVSSVGNVSLQTQMARNSQIRQELSQIVSSEMEKQQERLVLGQPGQPAGVYVTPVNNLINGLGIGSDNDIANNNLTMRNVATDQGITLVANILYDSQVTLGQGDLEPCEQFKFKFILNISGRLTGTPFVDTQEAGFYLCT